MKIYSLFIFCIFAAFIAFAQPSGYYNNASGKTCATLKTALKTIITTGNNPQSYGNLWTQYPLSDIKPRTVGTGSTNVIYDIYSTKFGGADPYQYTPTINQCGAYSGEGSCYNREHSVPLSWFNGNTSNNGPATDYLHIYPTDGHVNGKRANFIYGEVATASFTSLNGSKLGSSANAGFTGNVFEPVDSFKGDVARSFLYFVTRYEDDMTTFATNSDAAQSFDGNTFPSVKINYLKLMIKWHNLDPVSAKEKARNNAAYTFQGNRNPYIDHPEYVDFVWNSTCPGLAALPVDIISFSGKINKSILELKWQVGTEINLKDYEVERSFNGTNFTSIYTQEANKQNEYFYAQPTDEIRGRRVYFRIKKTDINGKYSYSELFSIHIPLNNKFSIYPNPVKDNVVLLLNENTPRVYNVSITDLSGRVVLMTNAFSVNNILSINTNNLSNGTYVINLIYNNERLSAKLIVQR